VAARQHVEAAAGAVVVHFDVDAIDSADLPLANYPHHGKGLTFDAAMTVLRELCARPALTALVLTEVNPTHDAGQGPGAPERRAPASPASRVLARPRQRKARTVRKTSGQAVAGIAAAARPSGVAGSMLA